MAGRETYSGPRADTAHRPPETGSAEAPSLEACELTKDFGPVRAVDRLNFAVRRGEIVGLLGPNGAGKTTVMRMLVGYLVPTAGTVRLVGGDIFRDGPRLKEHLGYLPENMPLYAEMTVHQYLGMAARLKGLGGAIGRRALSDAAGMLGLEPVWRRPTGQLSRGFRQRVGLAQSLLGDPQILILDEPTTGLDPNQISELRRRLRSWRKKKAILLSTHILAEALMLCDRVLILSRGRLVAAGTPQSLAGTGGGPATAQITVRGGEGQPTDGLAQGAAIRSTRDEDSVWRLEARLDHEASLNLMAHLARGGWEVLEWSSGLSALEQTFRKLTLEEGSERED